MGLQFEGEAPGGAMRSREQMLQMAMQQALQKQQGPQAGYITPGQREASFLQQGQNNHTGPGAGYVGSYNPMQQLQKKKSKYANRMLSQYGQVADLMGGDFQSAFQGQDMSDPIAAFKALSGRFSQQSQSQGVQDPRMMLAQLLMQARGQGGGG